MDKAGSILFSQYITPLNPIPTFVEPSENLEFGIKGILFDVYGTLFISKSGDIHMLGESTESLDVLDRLTRKYKVHQTPQELLNLFAISVKKKHEELKNNGVDFPEIQQDKIWMEVLDFESTQIARNFALEFELIVNAVYPMPNLKECLSELKRSGLLMGIISNAQFYTPYLFNWFLESELQDLGFHAELILFSYQFGYAKPSLFLFQKAKERLEAMGVSVNEILYVGNDMLNDIYTAKTTGFQTCLFAGDARSLRLRENHPSCLDLEPDFIITDLSQISGNLKGANHDGTRI